MNTSAKQPGWFSRRNKGSGPYLDSEIAKQSKENDYWARLTTRIEERAQRSPTQQLAVLDQKLGKGVGAKKERKRLKGLEKDGSDE